MATFTVTTAADLVNAADGRLSLREAVAQANANADADTILFASWLAGSTLRLTGGQLVLSQDVTIDGDDRANLTVTTQGSRTKAGSSVTAHASGAAGDRWHAKGRRRAGPPAT